MIKICFFAQTREMLGCDQIDLEFNSELSTIERLRDHLVKQGAQWALALADPGLMVALNQSMVAFDADIKDGDEIAFFPPVTGG